MPLPTAETGAVLYQVPLPVHRCKEQGFSTSSLQSRTQLHGCNEVGRWEHIQQLLIDNIEVDVGSCRHHADQILLQHCHDIQRVWIAFDIRNLFMGMHVTLAARAEENTCHTCKHR